MEYVCICILNYNDGPGTVNCIQSILNQTYKNWRIVIIDNGSTDDSLQIISSFLNMSGVKFVSVDHGREEDDTVKSNREVLIIKSGKNGGYSYGNNIGIRFVRASSLFSHILIINNDLVLHRDFLEKMLKTYGSLRYLYSSSKIALGATEYANGGNITHNGFHYLHLPSALTFKRSIFPSFKYITGSCIFLDREAPLMDESFFLYFDDIQYSKILKADNWLLESCETAAFIHEVGYKKKQNGEICRIIFESMRHFYFKNYPLLYPFVITVRILLYLALGRPGKAVILIKVSMRTHLQ